MVTSGHAGISSVAFSTSSSNSSYKEAALGEGAEDLCRTCPAEEGVSAATRQGQTVGAVGEQRRRWEALGSGEQEGHIAEQVGPRGWEEWHESATVAGLEHRGDSWASPLAWPGYVGPRNTTAHAADFQWPTAAFLGRRGGSSQQRWVCVPGVVVAWWGWIVKKAGL